MRRTYTTFAALLLLSAHGAIAGPQEEERHLRICADPNNLPFSNRQEEGFENKIAEIIAQELDAETAYYWHAQRRGFARKTLNAGNCDLIVGVPVSYEMAATTKPYYRSSYVWVYPEGTIDDLSAMNDARLRDLRIGVHLIGDDGNNTPPAHALGAQGIADNVAGYLIYGDYREPNPPARLVEAAANGDVDVAAVWGPIGGYFANQSPVPLEVRPITQTEEFAPLRFEFSIAMATRRDDDAFREEIEEAIEARRGDIRKVLAEYHVPLVRSDGEGETR